jgi:hypothetical protein
MAPSVASPSRGRRTALALAIGLLCALRAWSTAHAEAKGRDLDQVLFAARVAVQGHDPYQAIGPGRAFPWENGFYYPLTAPVAVMPLAPLPRELAIALFCGLGGVALAWTLSRRSFWPLLGMAGAPLIYAVDTAQWSPLLAAAVGIPALGALYAAKPTIGAALFVARPSRAAIIGALLLLAVGLALQPSWPAHWLHALRETSLFAAGGTPYLPPVALPGGALALLCLLRWRRPEARLVAALACVPQTLLLYEAVPLALVPASRNEVLALTLSSHAALAWVRAHAPFTGPPQWVTTSGLAMIALIYVPCIVMVLRRPNEGPVPIALERLLERLPLPRWVIGRPPAAAEAMPRGMRA